MAIGKNPDRKKDKGQRERAQDKKALIRSKDKKKQINIVRLMEANVDGNKSMRAAISSVRGVGPMFGNAVSLVFGKADKKVTDMSDAEIAQIEEIISNPQKHKIPAWLFNRNKDPDTGNDIHLAASSLVFAKTMDINNMKKLRSYRGIRHMFGLPVRGQRTRSSFRKGKSLGVSRRKSAQKKDGGK